MAMNMSVVERKLCGCVADVLKCTDICVYGEAPNALNALALITNSQGPTMGASDIDERLNRSNAEMERSLRNTDELMVPSAYLASEAEGLKLLKSTFLKILSTTKDTSWLA